MKHSKKPQIGFTEISDLLTYAPDTGVFTWKKNSIAPNAAGKRAGAIYPSGYRLIAIRGVRYRASRVAWLMTHKVWPSGLIDHINRQRSDDRISNLRQATAAENSVNCIKSGESGFRGVKFRRDKPRSKPWQAYIGNGCGKTKSLGFYETAEEASKAYRAAAKARYGEFCA
jgi:hypothetical protein